MINKAKALLSAINAGKMQGADFVRHDGYLFFTKVGICTNIGIEGIDLSMRFVEKYYPNRNAAFCCNDSCADYFAEKENDALYANPDRKLFLEFIINAKSS